MKKVICSLLAGALVSVSLSVPAFAQDAPSQETLYLAHGATVRPVISVRDAAKVSVSQMVEQSGANKGASTSAMTFGKRTMPRSSDGVRKQQVASGGGGGKTAMVVGLVTAVAGAAGGYLIYKEMKKETNKSVNGQ